MKLSKEKNIFYSLCIRINKRFLIQSWQNKPKYVLNCTEFEFEADPIKPH